jgi:uncharacterized Tic20 family protein
MMTDSQASSWAAICHAAGFSYCIGIPGALTVLILWLLQRDKHPFVDEQGREALNFQITMILLYFAAALLMVVLVGFVLLPVLAVYQVVVQILAILKTANGEPFRYPFTLRLV